MSVIKVHTTTKQGKRLLPKGATVLTVGRVAKLNFRLRSAMQVAIRDDQKKKKASMEKASKLVLNA